MKPGQSSAGGGKASFVICEICDGYIKDLDQLRNHMQWMHKVKVSEMNIRESVRVHLVVSLDMKLLPFTRVNVNCFCLTFSVFKSQFDCQLHTINSLIVVFTNNGGMYVLRRYVS